MAADKAAMIKPFQALRDLADSDQGSEDDSATSELSSNDLVPVDPELTKNFYCLQLIDEFRWANDATLIDELMVSWQDSSEPTENSELDLSEARDKDSILQEYQTNGHA